jgi:capsular exopolysaccharide synthesis family protein
VSPFELLSVLWRRKLLVFDVIVLTVAIATGLSLRQPKQYGGSAQLLFREPSFAQALFGSNLYSNGQQEPQRLTQTNIDVVTSRNVGEAAAGLLKTHESVSSLLKSVSVSPSTGAEIAVVTATRSTPAEAAAVANAFAESYISYRRQADRGLVAQAEELVDQSLKTAAPGEAAKLDESLRQLGVLKSLQTGNAEVIARAQPDGTPVSPKPKRAALLGFVVGLLIGSGLALAVDFLDRRMKSLEDFERLSPDYPVLASVPHTPSKQTAEQQLSGASGESYRMLREAMRFVDPSGLARCFLVTSADEGEGKSTVAVNLASALAAVGRKVILVDADMRRSTAAARLGIGPGKLGLSDLLVSNSGLDSLLVPLESVTGEPSLAVLPSGTIPPNSADLLSRGRMGQVLARACEYAEVVIVDSPPLLPVADTRVLLRLAEIDGVIMVGRAGLSRRDHVTNASHVLAQSGRHVFGQVITDVKLTNASSYYYTDEPPAQPARWRLRRSRAKTPA